MRTEVGQEWERILLRLPRLLKAELREEAQKNQRSMNAEILYRLMRSLNEYSR